MGSEYILTANGELYHHGVKGMKWGVRKKRDSNVVNAKQAYKQAKKDYDRAWNAYYNKSHQAYSLSKKKRAANDARLEEAINKAEAANKAKKAYKEAKKTAKVTAKTKARAERALAKVEKQKQKDFVNARSKEILKGESAVGKMWDLYTGAHKIQAEIEYNTRNYKD